ncbi:hypothetical protein ZWY2020_055910 [Hordeum vulgare]|nr:hypothetical protein ZWY2020_055910 [Hordeum vulgare]
MDELAAQQPDVPLWVRIGKAPAKREGNPNSKTTLEISMRAYISKREGNGVNPAVGTEFDSLDEAYQFYNLYSWEVGFGIRFAKSRLSVNRRKCMQEIVCGCASKPLRENTRSTRCGCTARIRLLRSSDNGCERANHMLKSYVPRGCPMHLFIKQYEKLQFDMESEESFQEKRTSLVNLPIERHASKIYTRAMFEQFGESLYKAGAYEIDVVEPMKLYHLTHVDALAREKWSKVQFKVEVSDDKLTFACECGHFKHFGMVCCHALKTDGAVEVVGSDGVTQAESSIASAFDEGSVLGQGPVVGSEALVVHEDLDAMIRLDYHEHGIDQREALQLPRIAHYPDTMLKTLIRKHAAAHGIECGLELGDVSRSSAANIPMTTPQQPCVGAGAKSSVGRGCTSQQSAGFSGEASLSTEKVVQTFKDTMEFEYKCQAEELDKTMEVIKKKLNGYKLKYQYSLTGEMFYSGLDAWIRGFNQREKNMMEEVGLPVWRGLVSADVAANLENATPREAQDILLALVSSKSIGYQLRLCRMIMMPVSIERDSSLYVFDMKLKRVNVLDPVLTDQSVEAYRTKHNYTIDYTLKGLKRIGAMLADGWAMDISEWTTRYNRNMHIPCGRSVV